MEQKTKAFNLYEFTDTLKEAVQVHNTLGGILDSNDDHVFVDNEGWRSFWATNLLRRGAELEAQLQRFLSTYEFDGEKTGALGVRRGLSESEKEKHIGMPLNPEDLRGSMNGTMFLMMRLADALDPSVKDYSARPVAWGAKDQFWANELQSAIWELHGQFLRYVHSRRDESAEPEAEALETAPVSTA